MKTVRTICVTKTVTTVAKLRAKGYRISQPFKSTAQGEYFLTGSAKDGFGVTFSPFAGDENIFEEKALPVTGNPFALFSLTNSATQ